MGKEFLLALAIAASAAAAPVAAAPEVSAAARADVYAPFDWLIGDWSSDSGIREVIAYGPGRSYVRYSVYVPGPGGSPHLHFDGIALWNGKTKMLDFLFAVEPGSGIQENGTIRVEADGSIVRDVELIDAKGNTSNFVNTFKKDGADTLVTSVMRRTSTGWEPTFKGGERIVLRRKPGTASAAH